MRSQVAIVGGGPAGQLLARILSLEGVACILLERKSKSYVLARVRAGLLEQSTVDTLVDVGCGDRLLREGLLHDGASFHFDGAMLRIDFADLAGKAMTVYGQTEVTRDLMEANAGGNTECIYEAEVTRIDRLDEARAQLTFEHEGRQRTLDCDYIAGCDGHHGIGRASIPASVARTYERVYPFGWLGILADVPPCSHELIYASHPDGFALATMRSPTRTRAYVQVALDDKVENWPDERFWSEYKRRLGPGAAAKVMTGPSFEKSIAPLRSHVTEPLRHGRLFLAGDAAHIVPPTGAKGLNLAVADVRCLSLALIAALKGGRSHLIDAYSATRLDLVWRAVRFSWWLTRLLHRFPEDDAFDRAIQRAEFDYLRSSRAAQMVLAQNYAGLATQEP